MPEFLTGLGQLWADNQVMGMTCLCPGHHDDDDDDDELFGFNLVICSHRLSVQ